ncbi:hypothetical protein FCM35_KLT20135 [Carex littledalei]|uniref:Uncharacterized protein n=1 Tax=Carex littledalei TaxID=544730 RepID=A0A833R9R2_9POAL|nr:hypothetical protein FCM35_KLT20135 [Carex littledalei]
MSGVEVPTPIPVPVPSPVTWMSHERIHEHHRDYAYHTGLNTGFRQVQVEKPTASMAQSSLSLRDGTNIHGFPNWLGH